MCLLQSEGYHMICIRTTGVIHLLIYISSVHRSLAKPHPALIPLYFTLLRCGHLPAPHPYPWQSIIHDTRLNFSFSFEKTIPTSILQVISCIVLSVAHALIYSPTEVLQVP